MKKRKIYKNIFARDFTLITIQIWYRAEVLDDKIWIKEKQPSRPYIVFEKEKRVVNGYYDPEGIEWIKTELIKKIKKNKKFVFNLEKYFKKEIIKIKPYCKNISVLNRAQLIDFLGKWQKLWNVFEDVWWLWEMMGEKRYGITLPKSLIKLRKTTEYFVPNSEAVIRASLASLYPQAKKNIDLITIEELFKNKLPSNKDFLKRRANYIFTDNRLYVGCSRKFIEDKFSIKIEENLVDKKIKKFNGQIAHKGKVKGKVKIVLSVNELSKVKKSDILVSTMTLPDFLPAIKRASAIITDEGGLLCHAAIISRELNKPCIIGTKIATKVLKDGDWVEVDANRGVVKIL